MGQYRILVTAQGGHGCHREKGDGDNVWGCRYMNCPDCRAREFVELLQKMGQDVQSALFVHWDGTPGMVVDDLLSKERFGYFPEYKDRSKKDPAPLTPDDGGEVADGESVVIKYGLSSCYPDYPDQSMVNTKHVVRRVVKSSPKPDVSRVPTELSDFISRAVGTVAANGATSGVVHKQLLEELAKYF